MNILAIDQARNGAWSVFNYETKQLVRYGTWGFDSKKYTFSKAVLNIEEIINKVLKKYDISAVFIEDIQMRVNVQSFKKLAQLQGVLVNLFEKNDYLYDYIAPTKWQNYCKARGRNAKEIKTKSNQISTNTKKSTKILSIQFVRDTFNIHTHNDNLADACCIGYYVVNNINIEQKEKK